LGSARVLCAEDARRHLRTFRFGLRILLQGDRRAGWSNAARPPGFHCRVTHLAAPPRRYLSPAAPFCRIGRHACRRAARQHAGGGMISQRAKMSVTVQYAAAGDDLPARPLLRRWIQAALVADAANVRVVLRFVEETESRALNRRHRRKDHPTNVLSFVYDDEH